MEQDAQMMRLVSVPLIDQNKSTHSLASLEVHSLNQHEDLALVDYIFADKTGTLTQNELVFRHLSVV
jgi:P-type E1-E2 ATPase